MLHEILFNATIPGAYMNAMQAAKERDHQNKHLLYDERRSRKPAEKRLPRGATVWAKFVSLFSCLAHGGAGQTPAE